MSNNGHVEENPALEIPIYLQLPPRDTSGQRRQLLLTVIVRRVTGDRTVIDVVWDEVLQELPYQPGPILPRPSFPISPGVRIFVPRNALLSPLYLVISEIDRVRLRARILVAVIVAPCDTNEDNTINVEVDARPLRDQRHARVRTTILDQANVLLRNLEDQYQEPDALRAILHMLSDRVPNIATRPSSSSSNFDSDIEVENLL